MDFRLGFCLGPLSPVRLIICILYSFLLVINTFLCVSGNENMNSTTKIISADVCGVWTSLHKMASRASIFVKKKQINALNLMEKLSKLHCCWKKFTLTHTGTHIHPVSGVFILMLAFQSNVPNDCFPFLANNPIPSSIRPHYSNSKTK